jgi:hypothetical protein
MASNSSLTRARQVCSAIILVGVLVLAVLAGRYLTFGDLVIETHGYLGNAIFLVALVNLGLGLVSRADGHDMAIAFALVVLLFAQIGLGYVGRDTLDAQAIHIPNGVLLMGVAGYQFAALRTAGRTAGEHATVE